MGLRCSAEWCDAGAILERCDGAIATIGPDNEGTDSSARPRNKVDDEWVDQDSGAVASRKSQQRIVCMYVRTQIHKKEKMQPGAHLQQGDKLVTGVGWEAETRENKVLEVEAGVEVEDEGSGLGGGPAPGGGGWRPGR